MLIEVAVKEYLVDIEVRKFTQKTISSLVEQRAYCD